MKVQFTFVGQAGVFEEDNWKQRDDIWTELNQIPREGDVVDFPGVSQALTVVRTVVWYPFGSDEYKEDEDMYEVPFVYIVIGNPRL